MSNDEEKLFEISIMSHIIRNEKYANQVLGEFLELYPDNQHQPIIFTFNLGSVYSQTETKCFA